MTTATTSADPLVPFGEGAPPPVGPAQRAKWAVSDALAVAGRNLLTLIRLPQLLIFSTIQPVIFVLLFRYAFGGAITGALPPGVKDYVDYLMPGIFVQTVAFGAMGTGIGLAADLQQGFIERFRSFPMARSAVLTGRVLSDLLRNVFVVILMWVVGYLVGFRIHAGVAPFLMGLLLILGFGCALSAMFALIGLTVGDPESTQAAAFPMLAPLVFASSAFVPVSKMPGWLQAFANHQPVSVTVDAMRDVSLGGPTAGHVVAAVVWSAVLLVVFGFLAVRRYRRSA